MLNEYKNIDDFENEICNYNIINNLKFVEFKIIIINVIETIIIFYCLKYHSNSYSYSYCCYYNYEYTYFYFLPNLR